MFKVNNLKAQHATCWDTLNFDCFSDNGDRNDFKKLDNLYADSIFILNTRNLTNWLSSRFKHGHRQCERLNRPKNWAYPCTTDLALRWINERESYYSQVLDYFKDRPGKLIILSIEQPSWKQFLSDELKIINKDFVNRNVNQLTDADYSNQIVDCINEAFTRLNYTNEQRGDLLLMSDELSSLYLSIYKNNIQM